MFCHSRARGNLLFISYLHLINSLLVYVLTEPCAVEKVIYKEIIVL